RDDSVERRLVRQRDQSFNGSGIELLPPKQTFVHGDEDFARARHIVFGTFDHALVAARSDQHAQAALDLDQVSVEFAEQGTKDRLLFERDFSPRAPGSVAAVFGVNEGRSMIGAVGFAGHAFLSASRRKISRRATRASNIALNGSGNRPAWTV